MCPLAMTGAQEPVLVPPSWPSVPTWQELVNQHHHCGPMPGLWASVESKLNVLEIIWCLPQRVGQETAWVVLGPGSKTLALSVYFRWKAGGHSLLGSQQLT